MYVLIDEYDRSFNKLFEEQALIETDSKEKKSILNEIKSISELIIQIITPLVKGNIYVNKLILTGIYNTLLKEANSGANNIEHYGILDSEFSEFFGFSEKELKEQVLKKVFKNYNNEIEEYYLSILKEWYNGQLIGNKCVFTPSSVMSYLRKLIKCSEDKINFIKKEYWGNTGYSTILVNIGSLKLSDELLNKIAKLSLGKEVKLSYNQNSSLYDFFNNLEKLNKKEFEEMVSYILLNSGYITAIKDENGEIKNDIFKIPAKEVENVYKKHVIPYWMEKNLTIDDYANFEELKNEFIKSFEDAKEYKTFIQKILSSKKYNNKTEADFQILLNGIASVALMKKENDSHYINSEICCSKKKKLDSIFYPKEGKSKIVILHEYKKKKLNSKSNKDELLEDGLWKIYVNQYMSIPINFKDDEEKKFWEIIKMRCIVFYKDSNNEKWKIDIIEHEYSFEEAKIINKFFSKDGKGNVILSNSKDLLGKNNKENKKMSRTEFLKKLKIQSLEGLKKIVKSRLFENKNIINNNLSKNIPYKSTNYINQNSKLDEKILAINISEIRKKYLIKKKEVNNLIYIPSLNDNSKNLKEIILDKNTLLNKLKFWINHKKKEKFIGILKLDQESSNNKSELFIIIRAIFNEKIEKNNINITIDYPWKNLNENHNILFINLSQHLKIFSIDNKNFKIEIKDQIHHLNYENNVNFDYAKFCLDRLTYYLDLEFGKKSSSFKKNNNKDKTNDNNLKILNDENKDRYQKKYRKKQFAEKRKKNLEVKISQIELEKKKLKNK